MTKLMGILNVTPDSFYDKGKFFNIEAAINRGLQIFQEGADIIDIGGESTRPGAEVVSISEELDRVLPVIQALKEKITIPISIDTCKPKVAEAAIHQGASLLNDVSGFRNPEMIEVAASYGVDICVMHMQGDPKTMQQNPTYDDGVVSGILAWFEEKIKTLQHLGIKENKIILDPGIGFGKTVAHNVEIIQNLGRFKTLGFRLLYGVSRKSFMSRLLNKQATELLPATLSTNTLLIREGVDIIRVHDVKEHRDIIDLLTAFN